MQKTSTSRNRRSMYLILQKRMSTLGSGLSTLTIFIAEAPYKGISGPSVNTIGHGKFCQDIVQFHKQKVTSHNKSDLRAVQTDSVAVCFPTALINVGEPGNQPQVICSSQIDFSLILLVCTAKIQKPFSWGYYPWVVVSLGRCLPQRLLYKMQFH